MRRLLMLPMLFVCNALIGGAYTAYVSFTVQASPKLINPASMAGDAVDTRRKIMCDKKREWAILNNQKLSAQASRYCDQVDLKFIGTKE